MAGWRGATARVVAHVRQRLLANLAVRRPGPGAGCRRGEGRTYFDRWAMISSTGVGQQAGPCFTSQDNQAARRQARFTALRDIQWRQLAELAP